MSEQPMDERLLDLEVKLAFQDRQVRQLDALVRQYVDRLEKAERELRELREALRSPQDELGSASEKPPHY